MSYRILVGGVSLISRIAKTRTGRIALRFSRGTSTHTMGQAAKKGVQRVIGQSYTNLSKFDQKIVDEITEFSVRAAANLIQSNIQSHLSNKDLDEAHLSEAEIDEAANYVLDAVLKGLKSRIVSNGFDFFFGKVDRNGQLLIARDLMKQAVLAAIGEALGHKMENYS